MAERIAYYNGKFMPESQVKISPNDRGFRMGDAVFEVERTFDGELFRLRDHLARLYRSLTYVRIDSGMSLDEMADVCEEVVKRNEPLRERGGDWSVRQTVTRGEWQRSVLDCKEPLVLISVSPINFGSYARKYDEGGHVVFARTRAYTSDALDPKVKHTSRMNFVLADLEAADVDPNAYAVMLDQSGNIAEGTSFNFFTVTNGVIRAASDHSMLQGVSRMTIAELARQLGIPMVEEDIQLYDAYTADEAFISATSYCILPIAKLDNRPINGEVPGPVVKQLIAGWSEKVGIDLVGQARRQAGLER